MTRVAVVGLDAAELDLVSPMIERGALPNLARLFQQGTRARLEDTVAHKLGTIFPQFLYDRPSTAGAEWVSLTFDPSTYVASQRNASMFTKWVPFYNRTPHLRTIAFDVPMMPLGQSPGAVEVVGWGASAPHYPRASRPRGLLREIDRRFGPHPAVGNDYELGWWDPGRIERFVDGLVLGLHRRVEIARWLLQEFADWELFVTVWSEPHGAGEYLWHALAPEHPLASVADAVWVRSQLERAYVAVDEALGSFETVLPSDCSLVVFAPYGMEVGGGDVASLVLLPELLHRWQFGETLLRSRDLNEWRRARMPVVVPDDRGWEAAVEDLWMGPRPSKVTPRRSGIRGAVGRLLADPLGSARSFADRRQPGGGVGVLGVAIPPETRLRPRDIARRPSAPVSWLFTDRYRRYWPRSLAFALPTFRDGVVRVNLLGREKDGLVEAIDYESTLQRVEDLLAACVSPRTDEPAVSGFTPMRENPFDGSGSYGDLLIHWRGTPDALLHLTHGLVGPAPIHRTGAHSSRGFAVLRGPGVGQQDLGTRSVLDLPATVITLLGESVDGSSGAPFPLTPEGS